jgi:hypothetical protein
MKRATCIFVMVERNRERFAENEALEVIRKVSEVS